MERKQLILFGAIFAFVVGVLSVAYFLFLRPDFTILYEDIREADAAQIVAELEKLGIDYQLTDDGHRVLVPEADVGRARVAVAGSGIAMGGVVGFELFNDSDMGLTEFAEKVNYQRALQGELARTIMMMNGISFARVHLSIPERTLFRTSSAGAKAAVAIETIPGRPLDEHQVSGIQQLVASAVNQLSARDVAILDEKGNLVSPTMPDGETGEPMDERQALEAYIRARAQTAAEKAMPGVPFEIRVSMPGWQPGDTWADGQSSPDDVEMAETRNFSLRVAFRTEADINEENRSLLRNSIAEAIALDPAKGDAIRFETGPLGTVEDNGWRSDFDNSATSHNSNLPPVSIPRSGPGWGVGWQLGSWALALLACFSAVAFILLRRRPRLDEAEQESFAELLAEQLASQEGSRNA